ncbi:MAG: hypothetical protein CL908_08070 [Deltaproteobacteria bacterium]|nr:hypothetical protein [Deltaproteobacteria bacterium]
MSEMPLDFAHPELANVLWPWLAVVVGLVLFERRGSGALDRLVGILLRDRLVDRPARWRRWARIALLALSGVAMIVALMQPQWGMRYIAAPRIGAEIMIALDVSRSMLADDARPSRLERAKAEVSDLLSYLDDDHVGLIAFAGRASVLSPLTPDKSFLRLALDSAGPHSVSRGGTRLAEPIRRALAGMGEPGPAQRALILITDGEDHDSFALDAAKAAAEAGIKIIAIGFGDEDGSQIHVRDPKTGARTLVRDAEGRAVVSRLDGDLLRELALATDGAFVPAGTGVLDLASIYDAHIARLTRGQLDERGRTIRDEMYPVFVALALACLVAAVVVAAGRRRGAERMTRLVIALLWVPFAAPIAEAQSTAPSVAPVIEMEGEELAATAAGDEASRTASDAGEDPRTKFNRANERLVAGEGAAAAALYGAARRDATDDVELRHAATYNLGMAAIARADDLQAKDPEQALAALYEAADWFREAAASRPEAKAPRHNLDVTLRRALILSDEIARQNERDLAAELDAIIEAQRARVAEAAALLENIVRAGELDAAEALRPAFREAATEQRLILADANALGERVAREREPLAATSDTERPPEEALRAAQLEGVLVYLDSAIERMGQTRRQLRQRRAERAYRRGSHSLSDLKRARDQLRNPVEQIGVLLGEVGRLAQSTAALSSTGLAAGAADGALPRPPAFLSAENLAAESTQIEARVGELAARLELAASEARESPDRAAPAPGSDGADQQMLREALTAAAPLVSDAAQALFRVTLSIGGEEYSAALGDEAQAAEALAAARERFFDLRQLLEATWMDESRIESVAGSDDPAIGGSRGEYAERLSSLQTQNLERVGRLDVLLDREQAKRLAELAAEAQQEAGAAPAPDPSADPAEVERQRFELADQLLGLAAAAMVEVQDGLGSNGDRGLADWPRVQEAAGRASERLDAIRSVFFTIAEHVRKLAVDQTDLGDRTRDAIALAVAEDPSSASARGPETRARASRLAADQRALEGRGGSLADALFVRAEELARQPQAEAEAAAGGATEGEDARMRRAAEHVAAAQLSMGDAGETLEDEAAALAPAGEAQALAVEELMKALALLSPPPPESQEGEDSQQEQQQGGDESESGGESQQAEQQAAAAEAEAESEEMGDASQLLQGVRDREAERRRERDRREQRRRSQPVEKDW